jgi:hypothetical protein
MRNLYKVDDAWASSDWISYFGSISNTKREEDN